jgi:Uncharacterized protein conserved in bacteria
MEIRNKIIDALSEALNDVPFLTVRTARKPHIKKGEVPDAILEAKSNDNKILTFIIEIKNNGQPRLIREGINQLMRYKEAYSGAYGIIAAPYISPTSAMICKKNGVGYIDMAGNCRLVFDKIYIVREGKENPFSVKRDLRSLYSPIATRVLRVLLCNPGRIWKTIPMAKETEVSVGQTFNVKKLLKDREWIEESKGGFRLIKPDLLLAEWAENYSFRKNTVGNFYSMKSLAEIETKLAAECTSRKIPYALTGLSGAARLTPGIRYQSVMAYVGRIDEELRKEIGLKEAPSGANATLLEPYDVGVFYNASERQGINVVSGPQLYLDLKNYKGRGEEAAQTIYEKVLRPTW